MWNVTHDDLESIAIGAGIIGTGGGGNPYIGKIHTQSLLKQGYSVTILDPDEVPDGVLIVEIGGMGAPSVGIEKLPNGEETYHAVTALESYLGRPIEMLTCPEVGGANSVQALIVGALTGKPVVDADAMGRAFPALQMSTRFLGGVAWTPAALVDEKGNEVIFAQTTSALTLEHFFRDIVTHMGGRGNLAYAIMNGDELRRTSVLRTLSLVKRVGDAVRKARAEKSSYVDAVLNITGGTELFAGKLIDVQRTIRNSWNWGHFIVEGLGSYRGEFLHVSFQNENLVAWRGDRDSRDEVVACVPDLICTLESESGEPITTEQLRYGLRATILGIPCTDKFRTPEALEVVGPAAFGYPDVVYHPMPKVPGHCIE